MVEETVLGVESIKEEVEVEDQTIPHSWDSGVVMDTATVTALQMAEFQQVVDNIQRQVVSQSTQPAPPPPYPYKVAATTWLWEIFHLSSFLSSSQTATAEN